MTKQSRAGIAVLATVLAWLGVAQPAQAARLPVTSTTALGKIQQEVPGLLTSLRKVKRDGFYAWAVTIKRSDGSVVVGYVDRKSGIVFDWTVQTAPDEPILDLDGPDRTRKPATPPPAVGEPLPPTAAVDTHPQPKPAVAAAATDQAAIPTIPVAPASTPSTSADSHGDDDDHDGDHDGDHGDDGDHRSPAVGTSNTESASASTESADRDDDDHDDGDDHVEQRSDDADRDGDDHDGGDKDDD